MTKRVHVYLLFLLLASSSVFTQGKKGNLGFGVGLVDPGSKFAVGNVPNADIIVPFWLSAKTVLQPRIGLSDQTGSQFRLGADFYYHFREAERMSPYLTGGLILFFDSKDFTGGSSQTDYQFNLGVGAEYFWHERASIGGDTGLLIAQNGASGADAFVGTYGQILLRWYVK